LPDAPMSFHWPSLGRLPHLAKPGFPRAPFQARRDTTQACDKMRRRRPSKRGAVEMLWKAGGGL
jgi:hypothetical protein